MRQLKAPCLRDWASGKGKSFPKNYMSIGTKMVNRFHFLIKLNWVKLRILF